ncbi:relaxase/mobilization nuclease domain-containing protein [Alistipes sp.]|uniref:relaxase/mobilization nuclease domain-containing protein n=1 Tax=Alistipes sp. TaxID=1872444 RepID=UPI0025C652A3|nr:relaxase/mobilization nuclease domain-containing protein [Alistipes sp.]MCI7141001.1 relaxase/mobilization nuclease domain-containing protein [Alistipes sp.]MDY5395911.1 relaxase/mobilization nuclease domain-containing protein [Alistipes sp.]
MIAKAATISHGGNAVRYSVNKNKAEIVKVNFLPDDISAEAMYQRMVLKQKEFASTINKGRPLKRNVIRMEISPTKEESAGWTLDDWARLANEYIQVFDSIDLSKKAKRASAKSTNVRNSQYVVALHHDAKSGIPHLHIDVNRVDMYGKVNDDHLIAERAMSAAYIINERRGWEQPKDIYERRRLEIAVTCMNVLRSLPEFSWAGYAAGLKEYGYGIHIQEDNNGNVRGYSVLSGNSAYKSSILGKGRHLMPSKIKATWARLHGGQNIQANPNVEQEKRTATTLQGKTQASPPIPVVKHYDISTDEYHYYHVAIPEEADEIICKECFVPDDNPFATIENVQKTALLLFAEYLDGAMNMAASSGGGGSDMSGWGKDKDEDEREWARRCAQMANRLCKRRKGLRR